METYIKQLRGDECDEVVGGPEPKGKFFESRCRLVDEQLANIAANKAEALARAAAKKRAGEERTQANRAKAIERKNGKAAEASGPNKKPDECTSKTELAASKREEQTRKVQTDSSWITQVEHVKTNGGGGKRAQRFSLFSPCLSAALDGDDTTDESGEEAAALSTEETIHVRRLARNIEAVEREQAKLETFLSNAHGKRRVGERQLTVQAVSQGSDADISTIAIKANLSKLIRLPKQIVARVPRPKRHARKSTNTSHPTRV